MAGAALLLGSMVGVQAAKAQESVILAPALPYNFNKGRNISVTERPRPDYDPIGINVGGFQLLPRIDLGVGYSDNIYLTNSSGTSAAYASVQPGIRLNSNWQRHQLQFYTTGNFKRYISESRRNESGYSVGTRGRLEGGLDYLVTSEARYSKEYESPLSADVQSNLAVLSSYERLYGVLNVARQVGRSRIIIGTDYNHVSFNSIALSDGTTQNQDFRNRGVARLSAQLEYALSPSISTYVQGSHDWTNYDDSLSDGSANRDSQAWRLIGGVNFDLTGFVRGTLAAGYVTRNFRSPVYEDVDGLSVEARVEYFPSQLTTYTLTARRLIADSSISNATAFVDNRLGLRVDHELLRNLILNASGEVAVQDYLNSPINSRNYRLSGGGRYLVNRALGIEFTMSYLERNRNDSTLGNNFNEFSGMISLIYQR